MGPSPSSDFHKPGFFWQGLLILFPVVVLAGLGVLSLRQDKLVAHQQAVQRAQTIAEALAPKLWSELILTNFPQTESVAFLVSTNMELLYPPSCTLTPTPTPLDRFLLTEKQARLWSEAQGTERMAPSISASAKAYEAFLQTDPPSAFAAVAHYSRGLALLREGAAEEAQRTFESLFSRYPGATGETGLPLEPLARLLLLESKTAKTPAGMEDRGLMEQLCSNVVWHPTPLSPEILKAAAEHARVPAARSTAESWQRTWDQHQMGRETFEMLTAAGLLTNSDVRGRKAFWCAADQAWLVMPWQTANGTWYSCRSQYEIGSRLTRLVEKERHIPDYFGVAIDVAGKRLTWPAPDLTMWAYVNYFGREGGGQKKQSLQQPATNLLASAQPDTAPGALTAGIFLTSPGALYAREQARVFWLAALITAAAAAAGIGFLAAYRAFHRQLKLSELKSNFVSSVSHELRAPIASVRLMAENLEKGKINDNLKQREYFHFIRQECQRLSSLVENVLDFSRIEQGRKQYDFEPTDIVALTASTVKLMQTYAEEKRVRIEESLPETASIDSQPVLDGKAIQQALINLIDNAIKHSRQGDTIRVGLEYRPGLAPSLPQEPGTDGGGKSSNNFVLWVEDHGEGIPAGEHARIFDRFYRVGSELRRETQGAGIGLSIVKHVVEAHGGRVLVRSELGMGSRFTIELPAATNGESGIPKAE